MKFVVVIYNFSVFIVPPFLQFLRLSNSTLTSRVYEMMTVHWKLTQPNLVVSVVGGEGRSKVRGWVREVLRQGLVKAAQSTGVLSFLVYICINIYNVWFLT